MRKNSLKESVEDQLASFLRKAEFIYDNACHQAIVNGLLHTINGISDYYEEGSHLFPKMILTQNMEYFKSVPSINFIFYSGEIKDDSFKQCLKTCAPLAVNGWNIFIELNGTNMKWGIISSEITELSQSLPEAILSDTENVIPIIVIENVGMKTVRLCSSRQDEIIVSLSLKEIETILEDNLYKLSHKILENVEHPEDANMYMRKIIKRAIDSGHGNLIAVVSSREIPKQFSQGISLIDNPLNLYSIIEESKTCTNAEDKVNYEGKLKMYASLVVSMINHDGIVLFTTQGEIIGYHYIVDNHMQASDILVGGARTKAFNALQAIDDVEFIYMRTQEGETKVWEKLH